MKRNRVVWTVFLVVVLYIPMSIEARMVPESFSEIVKLRAKTVVNISSTRVISEDVIPMPGLPFPDSEKRFKRHSLGSGFIIDSEGYILTSFHVVERAEDIRVTLWDESEYIAKIVGKDEKTDIALIKIETQKQLPVAPLGDSDTLEVGDWVLAIGNPFGLGHTVTAGIVSAKGRVLGAGPYDDFIQTDAAINPGNSGGPLFNLDGEVVGINTAIFSPSGGNIGIGFAIPINIAKEILPSLKQKGYVERGWLGVTVQKVTPEIAKTFGLQEPRGALVADITKGSPAEKAGIKRGDIIVEYNGNEIADIHELPRLVANTPIGSEVSIKVYRDGGYVELKVRIEKLKEGIATPEQFIEKLIGIKVKTLHPAIAEQFGVKDGGAVIVVDVIRGSPASKINLRKGDIIVEINRQRVTSVEEMVSVLKEVQKGDTVLLLLRRSRGYVYMSLVLE
jgi:serine protease Do